MVVYQFTEEQLFSFLTEYAGANLDASGKESLRDLLESLDEKGELLIFLPLEE